MSDFNPFANLPTIPTFRPAFNVGAGLDIPTGAYYLGARGESILNSGMFHIVALSGPPNAFKTTIILYLALIVAERIKRYRASIYDTEGSLNYHRLNELSAKLDRMSQINHGDETLSADEVRFIITSSVDIMGEQYFDEILDLAKNRRSSKEKKLTTPFLDTKGQPITIYSPMGMIIDSLSEFKVTANEKNITDKNSLGDSENNMYYMRQGIVKKQLMTQLPNLTASSGLYVLMSAHIGDEFDIGGMFAPKKHKLTHSKAGSKTIGTTKSWEFINNTLYEIFMAKVLTAKDYKQGVHYPILDCDKIEGCKDLLLIQMVMTRNKNGPSGAAIDLLISQREGVLPHLSQFHYIKDGKNFGIIGNDTYYQLQLVPDVTLSRTTVRRIIDTNPSIRRALEFLGELLQIKTLWRELPGELMCTPAELYNGIIEQGYDWATLFKTRGYWVFNEDEDDELPYLSTMDLLLMRKGLYRPYWLNDDKKTYNSDYKHLLNQ
jgi:hypothetical protein